MNNILECVLLHFVVSLYYLIFFYSYEILKEQLKQVIYDSFTVEEFEQQWAYVIKTHNVESDKWLEELFKESTMWAPVLMRDTFWAGMIKTHNH